jgi:hypothetical protein
MEGKVRYHKDLWISGARKKKPLPLGGRGVVENAG